MKSLYKVVLFRTSAITLAPLPLHTVSVAFVIPNVNSAALIAAYSNFRVPNALPGFPMRCLVRKCSGRYEETKNSTPLISSHKIHLVRVLSCGSDGCGWSYASGIISAVEECQKAGVNVISMSLGGSGHSTNEFGIRLLLSCELPFSHECSCSKRYDPQGAIQSIQ